MEDLEAKVRRLAEYLDEGAIARALDLNVDLVRAILAGEAVRVEGREAQGKSAVIQYVRPAFRQRVVCIARVKGGLGATTLALNIAWRVSEKAKVLLVDAQAEVFGNLILSDFLDLLGVMPLERPGIEGQREVLLSDNIYLLPLEGKTPSALERAVLEARARYDAVIIDLPPLSRESGFLKVASAVICLYGGGYAEGLKLVRHAAYSRESGADILLAATARQVALDVLSETGPGSARVYLPRSGVRGGIYEPGSPACRAVGEIVREVWGREMGREERPTGLLERLLRGVGVR